MAANDLDTMATATSTDPVDIAASEDRIANGQGDAAVDAEAMPFMLTKTRKDLEKEALLKPCVPPHHLLLGRRAHRTWQVSAAKCAHCRSNMFVLACTMRRAHTI